MYFTKGDRFFRIKNYYGREINSSLSSIVLIGNWDSLLLRNVVNYTSKREIATTENYYGREINS
ncbi:MAG: hypothetical protein AB4372_27285 [Xenococcus sp. (in: cyanobacteria)]